MTEKDLHLLLELKKKVIAINQSYKTHFCIDQSSSFLCIDRPESMSKLLTACATTVPTRVVQGEIMRTASGTFDSDLVNNDTSLFS